MLVQVNDFGTLSITEYGGFDMRFNEDFEWRFKWK